MTPQIRFPEFTDEWQVKKLGEVARIFDGTHQTPNYVETGVPFYSVEHVTANDFNVTKFISEKVFQKEKNKPERGDILMTRIGDIGTARYVDWDARASFYVSLALIKGSDEYDGAFLEKYITTSGFQNELWRRTLHVAFPKKINLGDISQCYIELPSKTEQEKIADFIGSVDSKLTSIQAKVAAMREYKKGIMQALFSGKLRFKDEDGSLYSDWEEKAFGDIATVKMGQSPSSKAYNQNGDGLYLIQGNADIKHRHTEPRYWTNEITKTCDVGDIILTVRAPSGYVAISKHKACIGRGVSSITVRSGARKDYIYQFLLSFESKWISIEQGSTFMAISGDDIRSVQLKVPCPEEQQKIADFLGSLDEKIKAEEAKLASAKEFKKALLQRMFV